MSSRASARRVFIAVAEHADLYAYAIVRMTCIVQAGIRRLSAGSSALRAAATARVRLDDEVAGLRKLQQNHTGPFVFVSERGGVLSADMLALVVACWLGGSHWLPRPPPHAAARRWPHAGQCRHRHPSHPGFPGAPRHPQYRALHAACGCPPAGGAGALRPTDAASPSPPPARPRPGGPRQVSGGSLRAFGRSSSPSGGGGFGGSSWRWTWPRNSAIAVITERSDGKSSVVRSRGAAGSSSSPCGPRRFTCRGVMPAAFRLAAKLAKSALDNT